MKGSSKVIMGTTIAIVVLLVVVLGLVLVLLAELYCSLLFRKRKLSRSTKPGPMPERPDTPRAEQVQDHQNVPSPLSSFYAQGVLEAPRRFLFPKVKEHRDKGNNGSDDDIEKLKHGKHGKLCKFLNVQIGIPSSSISPLASSPCPSYISLTKPTNLNIQVEDQVQDDQQDHVHNHDGGAKGESLMYISNPIYDNDVARASHGGTPFETPRSSPSRLDHSGSSSEGEETEKLANSSPASLPLSPMKGLPEKACSVALRDVRSLGSFRSEGYGGNDRFSSSSVSPYTSPSW